MICINIINDLIIDEDYGTYTVSVYDEQFEKVFETVDGLSRKSMEERVNFIKEYFDGFKEPYEVTYY